MGFKDVLKKSFLEGFTVTELSTTSIVLVFVLTACLGIYIFAIYHVVSRKAFYSKSFNISLVALALVTAAIILTIQSSVVISLGMVGALSIVRFRSAIKDPMDLVFLFWAISVGIICGAGLFKIAIIVSVIITVVILGLEMIPTVKAPLLLVVNATDCDMDTVIIDTIKKYTKRYAVKSHNITKNGMDMIIELRMKEGQVLVKEIAKMEKINMVSLLSHDGEVTY